MAISWEEASVIIAVLGTIAGLTKPAIDSYVASRDARARAHSDIHEKMAHILEWKEGVAHQITELRNEIERIKEVGDVKDQATAERLRRMEEKLDELLALLIEILRKEVIPG